MPMLEGAGHLLHLLWCPCRDSGCMNKYSEQSSKVGFAFLAPSQTQQTLRSAQIMCPNIPHGRLKIKPATLSFIWVDICASVKVQSLQRAGTSVCFGYLWAWEKTDFAHRRREFPIIPLGCRTVRGMTWQETRVTTASLLPPNMYCILLLFFWITSIGWT